MTPIANDEVGTLLLRLAVVAKEHDDAKNDENAARKRATTALNTLNEVQKAFDKLVDKIRADATPESDWKRSTERVFPPR